MKTIIKSIKDFFIAEFTKEVCEKHPKAEMNGLVGCMDCYGESCTEYHHQQREKRIEEIKEAIIRANKELSK